MRTDNQGISKVIFFRLDDIQDGNLTEEQIVDKRDVGESFIYL